MKASPSRFRSRGRARLGGRRACLATFAAAVALLASAGARAEYSARTNFVLHCQGCHGEDGIGGTPGEVPPLARSVGWFLRVPGGRAYLAQVPGAANAPVSDAALAALLNYMIETYSRVEAGDAYRPYTEAEVAAVRRNRPDIVRLRARLLEEIRTRHGVELWSEDGYAAARVDRAARAARVDRARGALAGRSDGRRGATR